MTNEQIRIAIAESLGFCGGKLISYQDETICDKCENNGCHPKHNYPNYPVDLNAMHEVEKTLEIGNDGSEADDYQQYLYSIVNSGRSLMNDMGNIGADVTFIHNL